MIKNQHKRTTISNVRLWLERWSNYQGENEEEGTLYMWVTTLNALLSLAVTCAHILFFAVLSCSISLITVFNCIFNCNLIFSFFFTFLFFLCISLFFIVTSSFLAPRWARCGGAGGAWHKAGIRELRPEPRWNNKFKNDENCNMKIMKTTNISKHANCCKQ